VAPRELATQTASAWPARAEAEPVESYADLSSLALSADLIVIGTTTHVDVGPRLLENGSWRLTTEARFRLDQILVSEAPLTAVVIIDGIGAGDQPPIGVRNLGLLRKDPTAKAGHFRLAISAAKLLDRGGLVEVPSTRDAAYLEPLASRPFEEVARALAEIKRGPAATEGMSSDPGPPWALALFVAALGGMAVAIRSSRTGLPSTTSGQQDQGDPDEHDPGRDHRADRRC